MTPTEYLISKGWRLVGRNGGIKYWIHEEHQPARKGCFTTTNAANHQRRLDKGYVCSCVPNLSGPVRTIKGAQ